MTLEKYLPTVLLISDFSLMDTYHSTFDARYGSSRSYARSPSLNFRRPFSLSTGSSAVAGCNDVVLTSISPTAASRRENDADSVYDRPSRQSSKPPLPPAHESVISWPSAASTSEYRSSFRRVPSIERTVTTTKTLTAAPRVSVLSRRFEPKPPLMMTPTPVADLQPQRSPITLYRVKQATCSVPDVPSYVRNVEVRDPAEQRLNGDSRKTTLGLMPSSPVFHNLSPVTSTHQSSKNILVHNVQLEVTDQKYRQDDKSLSSVDSESDIKRGLLGLKNIGNTCFMNSVIQCLSNTRLLREYCLRSEYSGDLNSGSKMKGSLMRTFADLVSDLWTCKSSGSVNPEKFKVHVQKFAPRFCGYSQQDAQEFLRYVLEGLHEDVNRTSKEKSIVTSLSSVSICDEETANLAWYRYLAMDNSRIVDIFVGQLKSELKCVTCGHVSTTYDPFWDLSLQIPQNGASVVTNGFSSSLSYSRTSSVTLADCMNAFTREEILDGDEKPTCERCKTRRKCLKRLSIQKFPVVLVLHMKRFSGEHYRSRLSTFVDFPLTKFDLSPYICQKTGNCAAPLYDLYAISNHTGTPLMGHYTAYCKRNFDRSWYLFDDSRVTPVDESELVSSEAYLLFYELNTASKMPSSTARRNSRSLGLSGTVIDKSNGIMSRF